MKLISGQQYFNLDRKQKISKYKSNLKIHKPLMPQSNIILKIKRKLLSLTESYSQKHLLWY